MLVLLFLVETRGHHPAWIKSVAFFILHIISFVCLCVIVTDVLYIELIVSLNDVFANLFPNISPQYVHLRDSHCQKNKIL
jgi:hypothetical protein